MKILSDEFKQKVKEDLKISDVETDNINNLSVQHRYCTLYFELKRQLQKYENEYDDVYGELFHYYKFDYEYSLSKTEIDLYIKRNEKFKKINKLIKMKKLEIEMIGEIINLFKNRGFAIKNIIDIRKLER